MSLASPKISSPRTSTRPGHFERPSIRLSTLSCRKTIPILYDLYDYTTNFGQGWAIKGWRISKRYSQTMRDFLRAEFDKGVVLGKSSKPQQVLGLMKSKRAEDGTLLFKPAERLTEQKIKAYFSRLARQRRLQGAIPVDAGQDESEDDDDTDEEEEEQDSDEQEYEALLDTITQSSE